MDTPLWVIRMGDAVPEVAARRGEFFGWIRGGVGRAWAGPWAEHDARGEAPLPSPRSAGAFVLTGSASSVTERAGWMVRTEAWLREVMAADVPVLAICFGHQLLAQALGGSVTRNARGREIGTVTLHTTEDARGDAVFGALPPRFDVNATHVDAVDRLPSGATRLARTDLDPNAAFRVGRAWAVQPHPEIDADVMRGYMDARRHLVEAEGLPFERIRAGVADAPHATALMQAFARAAAQR